MNKSHQLNKIKSTTQTIISLFKNVENTLEFKDLLSSVLNIETPSEDIKDECISIIGEEYRKYVESEERHLIKVKPPKLYQDYESDQISLISSIYDTHIEQTRGNTLHFSNKETLLTAKYLSLIYKMYSVNTVSVETLIDGEYFSELDQITSPMIKEVMKDFYQNIIWQELEKVVKLSK